MKSVLELRDDAIRMEPVGCDTLRGMTDDELKAAYNGIGPDSWPADVREKLSDKFHIYLPAVMIHDVDFGESDGTRETFDAVNRAFRKNCRACADDAYPWYSWRRYQARAGAEIAYKCVASDLGWEAWQEAANKNPTGKAT